MKKPTAWDVFLKARELSSNSQGSVSVPINTIAMELAIEADLTEQYAISLHMLEILYFDNNHKEIILPGNLANFPNSY